MNTTVKRTLETVVTVACAFLVANAGATTINFSDDTFDDSNYTQKIYQPTNIVNSVGQTLASGNPAPAAWVTYATDVRSFNIVVGLFRPSFSYDAAINGPLRSISASLDRYFAPVTNGVDTPASDLNLRTLIQQGGQYFQASKSQNGERAKWVALTASNLLATDFVLYDFATNISDPNVHPDFSQDIDAFGFAMRATGAGCNAVTGLCQSSGTLGTDNWSLTLTSIPEPASLALFALAALTAGFSRKAKRC